ncbi:hypothetical protein MLD52_15300 [Puniceicoccaceae bacterium K14]|nr:hypothetical protein [Puniceicoccaceae bacterium K14]
MEWERSLIDRIESLSLEEVNAVAKKYMQSENLTIVRAGDFVGLSEDS